MLKDPKRVDKEADDKVQKPTKKITAVEIRLKSDFAKY